LDTKTELNDYQVATYLRVIQEDVRSLPKVEQRWTSARSADPNRALERQAFHAEWQDTMDMVELLTEAYEARALSEAHMAQLLQLAPLLAEAIPTLRRLELREPPPELLQRLLAATPSLSA
jgi:hypothetical protein